MAYSARFEQGLTLAARAHARQHRKGTDIPYVTHLVHVARMLDRHGFDEDIVLAGLLHDLLEDTAVTRDEIERSFGARVADLVEACSEPDHPYGWWEDRKAHTIEHLKTAPSDVRAVACADKLHNLSTIRDDVRAHGASVWRRFSRPREDQEWYFRGLVDSLGDGWTHPLLDDLRRTVDEVFGPVRP